MNKRYLVILAATTLAAGVLAGAYYIGGPGAAGDAAEREAGEVNTPGVKGPELATLPTVDRDSLTDAEESPIYGVDNFDIFVDDGETVTRLRGSRANPRENFISDVERPVAEVRFAPTRLLTIQADSGTFFHPGNVPQRGEFHANTVLTLYESPGGVPLDTADPAHVQFRLYFDDVTAFNREEGIVSTEGPVRLVRPDADFAGRGLDLTYNNLSQRIERMVIHHADELRLATAAGTPPAAAARPPAEPRSAAPRSPDPGPAPANPDTSSRFPPDLKPQTPDPGPTPAATAAAPTFYQAVMADRVRIRGNDANLAGDTLTVLFSLAPAAADDTPAPADSTSPPTPSAEAPSSAKAASAADISTPTPTPASAPESKITTDPRALLTPSDTDLVLHWDGQLVLTPLGDQPPELAGPGDARFTLGGTPARLDTDRDEHVTAATLGYHTAAGRVVAASGPATPVALTTPDLGRLTGSSLWVEQSQSAGQLVGPGTLDTPDHDLAVTFNDRLDLAFAPTPGSSDAPGSSDGAGGLGTLDSATFVGQVHAVAVGDTAEDQLDLRTDALALSLTTPPATADEPDPKPRPSRLLATGNVRALQPGNRLTTDQLDIALAPPDARAAEQAAPADGTDAEREPSRLISGAVDIARLRALGNVDVQLTEDAAAPGSPDAASATASTTLTAHALDADPRAGRLELFGLPDADATLNRDDATLTGQHLVLLEQSETADVIGPGTFTANLNPDAPGRPDAPEETLRVTWQRSMAFDNRTGRAHFLGEVDAASTTPTDDTQLQAHDLTLTFDPQALSQQDPDRPAASGQRPAAPVALRHALATAIPGDPESEVTFSARTFPPGSAAPTNAEPDQPREAVTRLTLIGPRLIFTNEPPNLEDDSRINDHIAVERVVVEGKGKMLLEDFRLPADVTQPPETSGGGILMAGPGVTLFAWLDRLTLDAQANDMLIEGDVWMVHKPLDTAAGRGETAEPIKLDAQRLLADLTETGGLGAWVGDAAPTARVRQIDADGAVRVTQGNFNVVSDHLRYVEAERNVLLWADPGRGVTLTRDDQPDGSTTAAALTWDLDTNVFRGLNPDSGVIPLR